MDRIVGDQELTSPTAGPKRLNSDTVANHRVIHFSSPYENQELINLPSSHGSANSHPRVDGYSINNDCERRSSPWLYTAYSESNVSRCDNMDTQHIGWSLKPRLLGMASSQQSSSSSVHRSADHDVGYNSVDQSSGFSYPDTQPNKTCFSSLSSCPTLGTSSVTPSQTESCFHLSSSLLDELSVSGSSAGLSNSYFSPGQADKSLASNGIRWNTCERSLGCPPDWSAVKGNTSWSSIANHTCPTSPSQNPLVHQSDAQRCREVRCTCRQSSSICTFGLSNSCGSSSCSLPHSKLESCQLSNSNSATAPCNAFISSGVEDVSLIDLGSKSNPFCNQVQSRDASCFSVSSKDIRSPLTQASYSQAARHDMKAAVPKCSDTHKTLALNADSVTSACSSHIAAHPSMPGKLYVTSSASQPSSSLPSHNRQFESNASMQSRTIDHYSKYGLDFLEECEPRVSDSKIRHDSSDKTTKTEKTISTSGDQFLTEDSRSNEVNTKVEKPLSESVNQGKQQTDSNLFFDPRRIFSTDKRKVANYSTGDVLNVHLKSVLVDSVGLVNEGITDKHVFDPQRFFSPDVKLDEGTPAVSVTEQGNTSQSREASSVHNINDDNRPASRKIQRTKEDVSSSEPIEHCTEAAKATAHTPISERRDSQQGKRNSLNSDKPVPSSGNCVKKVRHLNDKQHASSTDGDRSDSFGHDKGRLSRESAVSKHGRSKHTSRRKQTNHRHGVSAGHVHPFRVRSDNLPASGDSDSGVTSALKYIWMKIDGQHLKQILVSAATEFLLVFVNVLKIVVGIIVFELWSILLSAWQSALYIVLQVITLVRAKTEKWRKSKPKQKLEQKSSSLSDNIPLPTTGEEAMRRLFACNGKDPYSILGLKVDCSDEDIKRYYRRQAVLVHPDKNREPGAEEAFKILNHAFEMIGEPANRQLYDIELAKEHKNNAAMEEFTDLLTKLHEVMKETINLMACNCCGGKHRRYPVDLPSISARYCSRCNERHAAKEGDVWAESTALGFRWHYFACMEGEVYNITEWAKCQHEDFKHLKANSHFVLMHISTGGKGHSRPTPSESDLEQLLSSLFASASPNGTSPNPFTSPFFQSSPPGGATEAQSGQTTSAGSTASRGRRRKKRR